MHSTLCVYAYSLTHFLFGVPKRIKQRVKKIVSMVTSAPQVKKKTTTTCIKLLATKFKVFVGTITCGWTVVNHQ